MLYPATSLIAYLWRLFIVLLYVLLDPWYNNIVVFDAYYILRFSENTAGMTHLKMTHLKMTHLKIYNNFKIHNI
jgi:hypothetical protein